MATCCWPIATFGWRWPFPNTPFIQRSGPGSLDRSHRKRCLTTSAVLAPYGIPPLTNKAAWSTYEGFRADERIGWVDEPRGLETHWRKLASVAKPSPKLWMDAYLAAFALAGGYQIVTTDKAFKQFKRLDLIVLPNA